MKHTPLIHKDCAQDHCPVCVGGLVICTVCGGAESELTTECCGKRLSNAELAEIQAGYLNFKDGLWFNPILSDN